MQIAALAMGLLLGRVYLGILQEYAGYFPPDFDSSYLAGRRWNFGGRFAVAFYTHLISSPMALALMIAARITVRVKRVRWHRSLGRAAAILILIVVAPSGAVMALDAYGGPPAAAGFMMLSLMTAATMGMAVAYVTAGNVALHRRWVNRCLLLMLSPLLLRLAAALIRQLDLESMLTYQINAWASWCVPLAVHELLLYQTLFSRCHDDPGNDQSVRQHPKSIPAS